MTLCDQFATIKADTNNDTTKILDFNDVPLLVLWVAAGDDETELEFVVAVVFVEVDLEFVEQTIPVVP